MEGGLSGSSQYRVPGHIGLESNEATDELVSKGFGTALNGQEPFRRIGKVFMAVTLRNDVGRLGKYTGGIYLEWNSTEVHGGIQTPHKRKDYNGSSHWSLQDK